MLDTAETLRLAAAVFAGVLIGAFYFGGLWWTVRRMPHVPHSLALYFGSLALRLAIVLVAFYGVLVSCDWPHLLASLVGFVAIRIVLVRCLANASPTDSPTQKAA